MKSYIELKAIAFDKYMSAAESKWAPVDMVVASVTLNAIYCAEKMIDEQAKD